VRYSLQAPHLYESSNSLGTLNILEAARRLNVTQVVLASSSSVYGGNTKVPFAECDSVDNPVSLYAATKRHNELQAHAYHHLYGLNVICLRLFTVYGPWGRPDMALFKFVKKIMAATPIDVYNQGNMARDFTFISDIVAGIVAALRANHLQYEIINLGNSRPVKLLDFVTTIESVLGVTARKNYLPLQPGDVPQTYADISKARQLLNYEPQVDIETGVKKFIDWYRGCEVKLCQ
jgi:UDP-glucuronate 4-epimerase